MIDNETLEKLALLRPLKSDVLHRLKQETIDAIYAEMGPRPRLADYMTKERLREWRMNVTPVDWMMLLVLLFIFLISAVNQSVFNAELSLKFFYEVTGINFLPGETLYTVIHILGLFFMAETGVIAFAIRNYIRVQNAEIEGRTLKWWERWLHPDMIVAMVFAIIAIVANTYSMVAHQDAGKDGFFVAFGGILGFVIPLITIYLGDHFGRTVSNIIVIKKRLQTEYENAANEWDNLRAHPDEHSSYLVGLRSRIGEWYRTYAPRLKDFPADFEWSDYILMVVAARELARLRQNDDSFDAMIDFFGSPGEVSVTASQQPSVKPLVKPSQKVGGPVSSQVGMTFHAGPKSEISNVPPGQKLMPLKDGSEPTLPDES